jgi:hypothetical protein
VAPLTDKRYLESSASRLELYDSIWDSLELVWRRTAQALPQSRPVLVTSDHGYVYLGPGLSDRSLDGKDRPLKGKRFREYSEEGRLPEEAPEFFIHRQRRLVTIKGRCHNHPQAPSPSQSLYPS